MSNKVIWITGASTGIGKALAMKFSKNGWNVAISARRLELLEEISKQNQNSFELYAVTTNMKMVIVSNWYSTRQQFIQI